MKRDCIHIKARHEHGTDNMYTKDSCRCPECREAHRQAMSDRRRLIAYGRFEYPRNPAKTRNHIKELRKAGIVISQISKLSGVSTDTIGRISLGKAVSVKPETERKILAIKPDPVNVRPVTLIDGTGTARRLQALVTLGWSQVALARMLQAETPQMWKIVHGQPVTQAMANRVTHLYDQLWNREPQQTTKAERQSHAHAKRTAHKHGWLPPLCWDEDRIDDPRHQGFRSAVDRRAA